MQKSVFLFSFNARLLLISINSNMFYYYTHEIPFNYKQQTTNNKQQTTNNKQQTTNNKQQTTNHLINHYLWVFFTNSSTSGTPP